MQCLFVYLCIYIQVSTCSTCRWHNSPPMMLLSRKSAAGQTQDCFWSSSFLFFCFFLKYVVKKMLHLMSQQCFPSEEAVTNIGK